MNAGCVAQQMGPEKKKGEMKGSIVQGLWKLLLCVGLVGVVLPGRAATVEYIHTDALGSPVAVTNSAGVVIERREYEPYGKQTQPALANGPGYTGHVSDAATGLDYMQQRYYDPGIGAFLSVDPVAVDTKTAANFCRYCYAADNPYKNIDPDGRDILTITGGLKDDSINVAGHVASAVQGNGMSSFGNGTPLHSSVAQYISSQSEHRAQVVTVVPTTAKQDAAASAKANSLPQKVGPIDNCAVRTNQVLNAAGISTAVVPLPKATELVAASQTGAVTYNIPKGGGIPKALLQALPKFEAPKKKDP